MVRREARREDKCRLSLCERTFIRRAKDDFTGKFSVRRSQDARIVRRYLRGRIQGESAARACWDKKVYCAKTRVMIDAVRLA